MLALGMQWRGRLFAVASLSSASVLSTASLRAPIAGLAVILKSDFQGGALLHAVPDAGCGPI